MPAGIAKGRSVSIFDRHDRFAGFPKGDWESPTPPLLRQAVINLRDFADEAVDGIGDRFLKSADHLRGLPGLHHSGFETCYGSLLKGCSRLAEQLFTDFLKIASANRVIIVGDFVAWTYGQTHTFLCDRLGPGHEAVVLGLSSRPQFWQIRSWVQEYCDGRNKPDSGQLETNEQFLRFILRADWRAPGWLWAWAQKHFANDSTSWNQLTEGTAMKRLGEEETEKLLATIGTRFWIVVSHHIGDCARRASVDYAMQGIWEQPKEQSPHSPPAGTPEPYRDSQLGEEPQAKGDSVPAAGPLPPISARHSRRKPGRRPRLGQEFIDFAAKLWREATRDRRAQVSNEQLQQIAAALDAKGYVPPADYLEGKCAEDLRSFNSRNANSKIGPVKTWLKLVFHDDKDYSRGMRRLLSRCAKRQDTHHPLSGN